MFSKPGKEILLKAVIQSIPTYSMSIFSLPETLIDEIHTLMVKFWWGSRDGVKGVYWKNWQSLYLSKSKGELGFRDLKIFNQALLAKQGWRLSLDTSSLLARVLKAKYYPKFDFIGAFRGGNPSFTWRSIWGAKSLLREGRMWGVGNGSEISAWKDSWISG